MSALRSQRMHLLWVLALLTAGCLQPQMMAPKTSPAPVGPKGAGRIGTASPFAAEEAPVPYSLTFSGRRIEGFPGVHSGAYAVHNGKLVVIGGRANGMHNFPPDAQAMREKPAFPPTQANTSVWVIDLASSKVLGSKPTADLPTEIGLQWRATNPQHLELNGYLIIAGGYGQNTARTSMVTLSYATSVRVDALIQAVLTPQVKLDEAWANQNVGVAHDSRLKVTGGELASLGDLQLLVFGHTFDGEYTRSGSLATQTYIESVRMFRFTPGSQEGKATLGVEFLGMEPDVLPGQQDPDGDYHRRDLTVGPTRTGNGDLRIAAYGGVFKGGKQEGYLNPIYVGPNTRDGGITLDVDRSAEQLLSQYNCAAIPIFDVDAGTMYTTLVGGISYYYWNGAELKHDPEDLSRGGDGLPFINSVSTLRVTYDNGQRHTRHYLYPDVTFPPANAMPQCESAPAPFGGTGAIFIPDSNLGGAVRDKVIDYHMLSSVGRIGWIFGGIAATADYGSKGPNCASNMLYEVILTKQPSQVVELQKP